MELALQSVLPFEHRLLLVEEIDVGRRAICDLQLLKEGLAKIEPIDLDALLVGRTPGAPSRMSESPSKDDRKALLDLVIRLNDSVVMGRFGLAIEGDRVLQAGGLRSSLIKPSEMRVLKRLAHYNEIEAPALDATFVRRSNEPG